MTAAAQNLVADIGGTNTRVAFARDMRVDADTIRRFPNAEHANLGDVLTAYLAEMAPARPPAGACVAIAGPVRDAAGHLTNLDWTVDRGIVGGATGATTIAVLNDLQAQGHAIGHLAAEATVDVRAGADAGPNAAKLVIGVGTGFNAAPVYDTAAGRYVPPSEAGHAGLPIGDEADVRLARYVTGAHGFPAIEDVLSGRGLARIYAWLAEEAGAPATATPREILADATNGDARAEATLGHFARTLGTVAGNLALTFLPFGGIYLAGGMGRRVAPWLTSSGFEAAFCDKGRFGDFMRQFPVRVIDDDYSALVGCAAHLAKLQTRGQITQP